MNFPNLSGNIPEKQSYDVFTSQLIRYARFCQEFKDFRERTLMLVDRPVHQHFSMDQLRRTFMKFSECCYELLDKYDIKEVCEHCF